MQFRLEMVSVPVSDVDRAKAFYVDQLGFSTEQDVCDAIFRSAGLRPPAPGISLSITNCGITPPAR